MIARQHGASIAGVLRTPWCVPIAFAFLRLNGRYLTEGSVRDETCSQAHILKSEEDGSHGSI